MKRTNAASIVIIVSAIAFVLLLASGLFMALKNRAQKPQAEVSVVTVETITAEVKPFTETYTYTGIVTADFDAMVAAQAGGKVKKVLVKEGEDVTAGQTLALIDDTVYVQQAAIAKSGYEMAKLSLVSASSARPEQIAQAQAQYDASQSAAETAFRNYQRQKNLFEEGVVSRAALEVAELQYETAKAQFTAAKENLRIAKTGARAEDRRVLQLAVEQAGAQLKLAQVNLDYTRIIAPFAGKVAARMINEGDFVGPGTQAYQVVSGKGMKVEIFAPVEKIDLFKPGQEASVRLGGSETEFKAQVARITPAADPKTRLFKVELPLPLDAPARPQQFADVRVEWVVGTSAVNLPAIAVLGAASDRPYVFIVEGGKAKKVEVTIGLRNGSTSQVLEPLRGGEQVITVGQTFVTDGTPVSVSGNNAASASTANEQALR